MKVLKFATEYVLCLWIAFSAGFFLTEGSKYCLKVVHQEDVRQMIDDLIDEVRDIHRTDD